MSERVVILSYFDSANIRTSNIRMVRYEDTGDQPISRIFVLSNGTKIDLDGTGDSDVVFGQTMATFSVVAQSTGYSTTNTYYRTLADKRGKSGVLKGVSISNAGTEVVYVCTARLLVCRARSMESGKDTPLSRYKPGRFYVDCIWERKTAWAVGS